MKIRVAVAGLNRGAGFVKLFRNNEHCEVVAVCDDRPDKIAAIDGVQGFSDFDQMLDQARPDVVSIITPGPLHAPQSIRALEAGVNVLVETPNVYSVEQAATIVEVSRRRGLKYMLAENFVFMGWCTRLAELFATGRFGDLIGAAGEYTHDCRGFSFADADGQIVPLSRAGEPGVKPLWRLTDLPPLAYSSHTLGPLLALLDDRCTSVTGLCGGQCEIAGYPVYPLETAVLGTAQGRSVQLTNGFILGHPLRFVFALFGTTGAVRVDSLYQPEATLYTATDAEGATWQTGSLPWFERTDGRDHMQVMIDAYVQSIVDDTAPPFDAARSMDFCLPGVLAHESAKAGGVRLEVPLY